MLHKHSWVEIAREFGYQDCWGRFYAQPAVFHEEPYTCITYECEKCKKYRQKRLIGHVEKEIITVKDIIGS